MKILLPILILFACAFSVFSQNAPIVKKQKNRIIEVSDLLGEVPGMQCAEEEKTVSGVIVKRNFEDNEITISDFVISDTNDKRFSINLNDEQVGLLGRETSGIISSVLRKKGKVQVSYRECSGGGSAVFNYAEKIKVL